MRRDAAVRAVSLGRPIVSTHAPTALADHADVDRGVVAAGLHVDTSRGLDVDACGCVFLVPLDITPLTCGCQRYA